nr:1,2-phenylacetyl-CoA epoxidase subunit PaaD [Micromonospora sp. DSM 115978]
MARARTAVEGVLDPELPVLTLGELGVIRGVDLAPDGTVVVALTPTYSGCPALGAMRSDIVAALARDGFHHSAVRTVLSPPWTTDWITPQGRRKLAEHGIAPPGPARRDLPGPVLLHLESGPPVPCPRCHGRDTAELSRFAASACRSLHSCRGCGEPFEHVKAI